MQSEKTLLFIEKAKKIHGDRYDYSEVEYINSKSKITIICSEHGEFSQTPSDHLSGKGCSKCSKLSYTPETLFNKFKIIHGDKYVYRYEDLLDKKRRDKINIFCKIQGHGNFSQIIGNHLQGNGCPKCSKITSDIKKTYTNELYIKMCREKHGDKYDYTLTKYTSSLCKVKIKCKKGHVFEQQAHSHLKGYGCPICGGTIRTMNFINELKTKFTEIHSGKYDYSEMEYVDMKTPIRVKCNVESHGFFNQLPNKHKSGHGCPKCKILKGLVNREEQFIKKAKIKHGDRYVYENISYKNTNSILNITCIEHGNFKQVASYHLLGNGCPKCTIEKRKTTFGSEFDFVNKLKELNLYKTDLYDFSEMGYVNKDTPIKIIDLKYGSTHSFIPKNVISNKMLECSRRNVIYLPFEEARNYVQHLNFNNIDEYVEFHKTDKLPLNIPTQPYRVYKEWIGWNDWLGYDKKYDYKCIEFEDAKKLLSNKNLHTVKDYHNFIKNNNLIGILPLKPQLVYKNKGFKNFRNFLSSIKPTTLDINDNFLSYEEAEDFIKKFNIKNQTEWRNFCKEKLLPNNIPSNPQRTYKNKGWVDWGVFLGTGNISVSKMNFYSFEELKELVKKNNIKSTKDYIKWVKLSGNPKIPRTPYRIYDEWIDWADFTGYISLNNIHHRSKFFMNYEDSKIYVNKLNIKTKLQYEKWWDKHQPQNLPKTPEQYYKDKGWTSIYDWLNTRESYRWRNEKVLHDFIDSNFLAIHSYRNNEIFKKQHIDIFISEYNIAIEYQGGQHFQKEHYFNKKCGGLKVTQERDQRKREACEKHGIKLFYFSYDVSYVPKDYPYKVYSDEEELLKAINEYIEEQKLNKGKFAS